MRTSSTKLETETSSPSSKALTTTRWLLFALVLLIQAGAFLEGEFITGITGAGLCFFLTVHQSKVRAYARQPYFLVFTLFAVLFLLGSYLDAKYV